MPTIALDCQIILDGNGYFVQPGGYKMTRPRVAIRTKTRGPALPNQPVPTRWTDRGPDQRVWVLKIVAFNTLKTYDGHPLSLTGQQIRENLRTSYNRTAQILQFTDPNKDDYQVVFGEYVEEIHDLRTQITGLEYIITATLIEATGGT